MPEIVRNIFENYCKATFNQKDVVAVNNGTSALIAPLSFSLTKCLRRYLFKDIIAVSTPEKKAERNSRKTMLENSIQGLTSANCRNYVNCLHFFTIIGRFYLNTKLNYLEYASQRDLW